MRTYRIVTRDSDGSQKTIDKKADHIKSFCTNGVLVVELHKFNSNFPLGIYSNVISAEEIGS